MATYRVVCVKKWRVSHPEPHTHVVGVGTGERADWADMRWTVDDVARSLEEGDSFHTLDEATGQTAAVEIVRCTVCGSPDLRAVGDPAPHADLEAMRECIYE
jgi:hypothetical protein